MALLIKEIVEEVQYLTEKTEDGKKNYFIEGIIMQGGIRNRNGRVYPPDVLKKETKRYMETYVTKNRAFGELGHPAGPTINLDRVSHMFTDLSEKGNNIVGRAKIMDTPMGKVVKNLIDEGAQLGISSRGMGSLKQNKEGIMEVQNDFVLATAGDIVADPSAPDAFVKGIMEGVEYYYDIVSGVWKREQVLESSIKEINEKYSKLTEEDFMRIFKNFINCI